jgi:hypothetical protein
MDPKGKGVVVNDNEKESIFNEPRDDKVNDSGSSQKKKDGKKRRIRKVVYYDSGESSSSQKDDEYEEKKKTVNSNFSFDYSRIPHNSNAHPSIWETVENGMQFDSSDNSMFIN